MNMTTQSLDELSQRSPIYSPAHHPETTTPQVKIFLFDAHRVEMQVPAGSLDALVDDWAKDPEFAELLVASRRRRAQQQLQEEGDVPSLRSARLERGLSQQDVAAALHTSQPHIARIEGGKACPSFETARKLAQVLNVDLNTLGTLLPLVKDDLENCL